MVMDFCAHAMERRRALLFGVVVAMLLRSAEPQQPAQCNVAIGVRVNCGTPGITTTACQSKGCCFDSSTANAIFCFFPNSQPINCPAPGSTKRTNCAPVAISQQACNLKGCCFDNTVPGVPFCFTVPATAVLVPQCSGTVRNNCGFTGIAKQVCLDKGCCYDAGTINVNWCFHPSVPATCPFPGDPRARVNCAVPTTGKDACYRLGCCFDNTLPNVAFCFKPPTVAAPFTPAPPPATCSSAPPAGNRMQCGKDGISVNTCHQDLCCYDANATPKCYSPVPMQCTVALNKRVNCGFTGIQGQPCRDRGCCFDPNTPSTDIQCYFVAKDVTEVGPATSCKFGQLVDNLSKLVEQWINLVTKQQSVSIVLDNAEMFSLSTYCGLYTTAIDAIVGCAKTIVGPFTKFDATFDANFVRDLNNINNAKGICGAVLGHATQTLLCIPESVAVCSLLSFDLLVTFTEQTIIVATDLPKVCTKTEEVVRGISTCIGLSTRGCTAVQQAEYAIVRNGFIAVANRLQQTCDTGCGELAQFLLDRHANCSWNLPRLYPNPKIEDYCTYAIDAVTCAFDMWNKCRFLPYEYFVNALSVMETAFFLGGCTQFRTVLQSKGAAFEPKHEVKLPECVTASITCAKELSFGVGVNEMLGQFGGYSINQVKARIDTIGNELLTGNYSAFCGNPDQRASGKNPIRDCMNDLRKKCGTSATAEQIKIVDTAVKWYDEVCVPGCTNLGDKFVNFRTSCPDMPFTIDPLDVPVQLALGFAPNGKDVALCKPIQHYAVCVSKIIEDCTFLRNRITDARDLLIQVITQSSNTALSTNIFICGVKLDFPFIIPPGSRQIFALSQAASVFVPLTSWMTAVLCATLILLKQT